MRRLTFLLVLVIVLSAPQLALAFCGFYVAGGDSQLFNDATQVVLMRGGDRTVLSMQNAYEGPPENFAMVVPVPEVLQKENVKTLKKEVFDRVDTLSAPRLVEYWERDPCQAAMPPSAIGALGLGLRGTGRGGAGSGFGGGRVIVEAQFEVGEYDVVILSTDDSTALDRWLKQNEYEIPDGAEPYFRPYVESGMYFFVAKVDLEKVDYVDGEAVLSPLRFHYRSENFSLPIRLGMINSKGKQDLLVYILANQQRYQVANYPNVTIPTNIEVGTSAREEFGEFYEALFSRTVEENPGAVVTEYSWSASKCDPCPTGMLGGGGLQNHDIETLGNDVLGVPTPGFATPGWTLTRLHARYAPDDIGEDLVFEEAAPIVGGREVRGSDDALEKGSNASSSGNNFQGRYIIRHDWEGPVECDEPRHGQWGPPPDPHGMRLVADTVVDELRRQKAARDGGVPSEEALRAPWTKSERKAVAYHLKRRFGTSVPPMSNSAGPSTAPSTNTRGPGATFGGSGIVLASMVREPIPELKLEPVAESSSATDRADQADREETDESEPSTAGKEPPSTNGSESPPIASDEEWPPGKAGCSTGGPSESAWLMPLLMLAFFGRRRVRDRITQAS